MTRFFRSAGLFAAVILAALYTAAPANAQATRTWISGVGDDANPCSRTAPCKTFAGAISKTATSGEIDCLDPGGFGAVTITKSITLDCGGGIGGEVGSILASGTNGITINAASAFVKIRNMTINCGGLPGTAFTCLSGIKLINGSGLIVEHVGIFGAGQTSGSGTYGGVDFEPSTAATLDMADVETQFGLGDGVLVKPQAGGSATVSMTNVRALRNSGAGIRIDSSNVASGRANTVSIIDSVASNNLFGIFSATQTSGGSTNLVMLNHTSAVGNTAVGVDLNGATNIMRIGSSVVTGNNIGVASNGTVLSYGNNQIDGNTTTDAPTLGSVSLR